MISYFLAAYMIAGGEDHRSMASEPQAPLKVFKVYSAVCPDSQIQFEFDLGHDSKPIVRIKFNEEYIAESNINKSMSIIAPLSVVDVSVLYCGNKNGKNPNIYGYFYLNGQGKIGKEIRDKVDFLVDKTGITLID